MAGEVRLGIIVPSANTVVEKWYPKVCWTAPAYICPHGGCVRLHRVELSKTSHGLGKEERSTRR